MALRAYPIFTNFKLGEITPRLMGRIDWERYQSGCVTLENMIIQPQGGVTRRPGTRFVAEVKDSTQPVRLIPFRSSTNDRYVIEFGPQYARFYKGGARIEDASVPVEVTHGFGATTPADIWQVHYAQMGKAMVLTSNEAMLRLSRFSDTLWRAAAFEADPPATVEYGTRSTTYLVAGATTGTNIQFDAGGAMFLAADVGREILAPDYGGRATITVVDSSSRVHADISDDFTTAALTQIPAGSWTIGGSPQTSCTPSAASPVNASITLTLAADGWSSADVGKYVVMNEGMAKITAYNSATDVTALLLTEFGSVVAQPANAWSLEEEAWSDADEMGWPATVNFFEGRMILGCTPYQPDSVWMSSSYDYYNYALGSTDDAAINVRSGSGEYSAIRWFSPRRTLLMGTSDGEYSLSGSNDGALSATNLRLRPATPHGSGFIMPVRSEYATIFVTENGRVLRELAYAYEVDDYRAANLLDIAEHLTATETIVDLAYQRPPDSILWAARSDGVLLGCTYLRDQDLVGWHRHVTDGVVESVTTIQSATGTTEEVWMVVARTIGGVTKRYIEWMDAQTTLHWDEAPGLQTDSAVTYDGVATNTVTGLSHLEGKSVVIVGDGAVFPPATVASGSVTLAGGTASKIEVGLPFTSTLQTVRPEVPNGGTSQGRPKAWPEVKVRLLNTIGGRLQGEILTSPTPPVLYSGDRTVHTLGWDTDAWITVQQLQPLPMTVLCVFGALAVGD